LSLIKEGPSYIYIENGVWVEYRIKASWLFLQRFDSNIHS